MKAIARLQYGYKIPTLDEFSVATLKLILNLVHLLKALTKFSIVILSLAARIPAGPKAERFPHKTHSSSQAQGGYWLEWPAHSGTLEEAGSGCQALQLASFPGTRVGWGQCSHLVNSGEMVMVLGAGGRWLEQWLEKRVGRWLVGDASRRVRDPDNALGLAIL